MHSHVHTLTWAHTHKHALMHAYTHVCILPWYTLTYPCTQAHTFTHMRLHVHVHHTCTHLHTCTRASMPALGGWQHLLPALQVPRRARPVVASGSVLLGLCSPRQQDSLRVLSVTLHAPGSGGTRGRGLKAKLF